MTLSEFLAIFTTRRKLLVSLIAATLLLSIAFYRLQVQSYEVSLVLSVTRSGAVSVSDYAYDHFYRLQADERFADTLVRYLGTEQGKRAISERAELSSADSNFFLKRKIKATRLSSQLIVVSLPSRTLRGGERLATALPEIMNQYADELNRFVKDENWFRVVASEPLLSDARFSWREALLAGFIAGCGFAFWVALLDEAFRKTPLRSTRQQLD